MLNGPSSPIPRDLIQRIAAILRDRYEHHGADRVALRIVECVRPGDRFGAWTVVAHQSLSAIDANGQDPEPDPVHPFEASLRDLPASS